MGLSRSRTSLGSNSSIFPLHDYTTTSRRRPKHKPWTSYVRPRTSHSEKFRRGGSLRRSRTASCSPIHRHGELTWILLHTISIILLYTPWQFVLISAKSSPGIIFFWSNVAISYAPRQVANSPTAASILNTPRGARTPVPVHPRGPHVSGRLDRDPSPAAWRYPAGSEPTVTAAGSKPANRAAPRGRRLGSPRVSGPRAPAPATCAWPGFAYASGEVVVCSASQPTDNHTASPTRRSASALSLRLSLPSSGPPRCCPSRRRRGSREGGGGWARAPGRGVCPVS